MRRIGLAAVVILVGSGVFVGSGFGRSVAALQPTPSSWLDRPLVSWNRPGVALPKAPAGERSREALSKECDRPLLRGTAAERSVTDAGWVSFHHFDRQLLRDGVEILDGMASADGMCRPWKYNVFVFVDGRFAGTLAPELMNSREDGSVGAIRILDRDTISAEFERYTQKDALCCPSSRVTVRYKVNRSGAQPVVTPLDVRVTRSLQ